MAKNIRVSENPSSTQPSTSSPAPKTTRARINWNQWWAYFWGIALFVGMIVGIWILSVKFNFHLWGMLVIGVLGWIWWKSGHRHVFTSIFVVMVLATMLLVWPNIAPEHAKATIGLAQTIFSNQARSLEMTTQERRVSTNDELRDRLSALHHQRWGIIRYEVPIHQLVLVKDNLMLYPVVTERIERYLISEDSDNYAEETRKYRLNLSQGDFVRLIDTEPFVDPQRGVFLKAVVFHQAVVGEPLPEFWVESDAVNRGGIEHLGDYAIHRSNGDRTWTVYFFTDQPVQILDNWEGRINFSIWPVGSTVMHSAGGRGFGQLNTNLPLEPRTPGSTLFLQHPDQGGRVIMKFMR